jgi:hypothetical protein
MNTADQFHKYGSPVASAKLSDYILNAAADQLSVTVLK